jgi:YihY family inner membrane protein
MKTMIETFKTARTTFSPARAVTDTNSRVCGTPEALNLPAEAASEFVGNASHQLRAGLWLTLKYLTQTEVHTFAFSVAANAVLSFFPFMALLMTLVLRVFHSPHMYSVVAELLQANLPVAQDFIVHNLDILVRNHHGLQAVPLVMLLITSSGVFLPLEVALNQVWGFKKNRSYLANQAVSLGLAFACGILALVSIALTAGHEVALGKLFLGHTNNIVFAFIVQVVMHILASIASAAVFFLIYWLLPNGKVKPSWVLPSAIVAGVLLQCGRFGFMAALPWLDFKESYGPFYVSVTLIFWGFLSGLLLLGGAHLSTAGRIPARENPERDRF